MMSGMLRESEAVALERGDVEVQARTVAGGAVQVLHVYISRSKTDQEREGAVVLISENKGDTGCCPVARYQRYMEVRARAGWEAQAPLFVTFKGERMATATPCGIVQRAVTAANERAPRTPEGHLRWGEPSLYGSHSMRRGGVTAARASGASMLEIQRHGRWKSLTVFAYVGRTAEEELSVTATFLQEEGRSCEIAKGDNLPAHAAELSLAAAPNRKTSADATAPKSEVPVTATGIKRSKRKRVDSEEEQPTTAELEAEAMEDAMLVAACYQSDEEPVELEATAAVTAHKKAKRRAAAKEPAGKGGKRERGNRADSSRLSRANLKRALL
jgi:hypothetical protein